MPISLEEVRRQILIAMVSDDDLMNTLVFKGGNALALIHDVGHRTSVDMDFSIAANFPDLDKVRGLVFKLLRRQFGDLGYVLIDEDFVPKPTKRGSHQPEWWGGYFIEFKIIEKALFNAHEGDPDALRRHSALTGPAGKRTYTIDISKNEYCAGKVARDVEGYTVYVYSLEMIALEKLRAICQQMPKYKITHHKSARARDFYDIHEIAIRDDVDLLSAENREMLAQIFAAKDVSMELLGEIGDHADFHEPDWPGVVASVSGPIESFEYYFDFVVALAAQLKPSG